MSRATPSLDTPAHKGLIKQLLIELAALERHCQPVHSHEKNLHQRRVRSRRLRNLLKAGKELLPSPIYRLHKKYARITRVSNPQRDRQVLQTRLCHWQKEDPDLASASTFLLKHWNRLDICPCTNHGPHRSQKIITREDYREEATQRTFHKLNQTLRKKLLAQQQIYTPKANSVDKDTLGQYLALVLQSKVQAWHTHCLAWQHGQAGALHTLRLSVKSIRYLLLPWRKQLPKLTPWFNSLQLMQEMLGQIHDNHIHQQLLTNWIPHAAAWYYREWLDRVKQQLKIGAAANENESKTPGVVIEQNVVLIGLGQIQQHLMQEEVGLQQRLNSLLERKYCDQFLRSSAALVAYLSRVEQ